MKLPKIFKHAAEPDVRRTTRTVSAAAPRWVGWFTDIGRPLSAIVVMVLCAPGERHLALLAGWGPTLSWGMAGLLVMYAGIAAVVATVRPKGAPGKKTAVIGAILSLLLAMAAQPVSHYFVTGWMSASPRAPFWLVTVVSCVPPFVMGHLLHLAADPGGQPEADTRTAREIYESGFVRADEITDHGPVPHPDDVRPVQADTADEDPDDGADIPWSNPARWTADTEDEADDYPVEGGHEILPAGVLSEFSFGPLSGYAWGEPPRRPVPTEADSGQSLVRDNGVTMSAAEFNSLLPPPGETRESADDLIQAVRNLAASTPDTGRTASAGQPDAPADGPAQGLSGWIKDLWNLNPDMSAADVRTAVRDRFPDIKTDTVRKAVKRAGEAIQS